ncbi:unnamed protein product, partial [Effrenium voratum]
MCHARLARVPPRAMASRAAPPAAPAGANSAARRRELQPAACAACALEDGATAAGPGGPEPHQLQRGLGAAADRRMARRAGALRGAAAGRGERQLRAGAALALEGGRGPLPLRPAEAGRDQLQLGAAGAAVGRMGFGPGALATPGAVHERSFVPGPERGRDKLLGRLGMAPSLGRGCAGPLRPELRPALLQRALAQRLGRRRSRQFCRRTSAGRGVPRQRAARRIAGFERAAEWRFALNFLRSRCWAPNVFCYNSASSACARAGEWPICAELVRTVSGVSWQPDLITLNSALRATSVEGHWRVAKVLLKAIRQVGFQLSPVSCGSLTSSCGRCWRRAFHWLDYTKSAGVEVGEIPRNAVISACEKAAAWQAAVEAERGGGPSLVGCNSLLSACEKGSQWQMALHLLLSLPREVIPDEITFNAVLGAVLRVALDAGAYVSVMSVCEKASQWTAALDLLSALLRAALQPEGAAYSSAISSCGKAEQWERALQLPRGDAAAAAAAVLALERGSQWQAALGLFLNMRSQERSELGYLAAFGACEKGTRWRMGPQLLSAMQQQLLRPAAVASTAAVAAVAEEWPQAVLLLAGMRRRAVCDASPAFNAALGGLAGLTEWQLALAMLWRKQQLSLPMKGMNFGAAVSAANGARQWRQGAKLLASAWEVWGGLSAEDATESGGVWEGVEILAKGPGLVAINKPSGVSTEAVLAKLPVAAVSRLDKPTSGVLVAALGSDCSPAFQLASAQFSARSVVKEYLCLCHGSLGAPGAQGRTARPLLRDWASGRMAGDGGGGAAAATAFEVLEVFGGPGALTLLKVTPETGRRHQIRVHLASLGRPIVSDPLYGSEDPWCPQLFLHCRRTVLLDAAGGA